LPPLGEQRAIVARVDELMTLCNEIEHHQARATTLRATTAQSALATIVESDRGDVDHAVRLVNEHVRECLVPGQGALEVLSAVRDAILHLAVRGRLVAQVGAGGESQEVLPIGWESVRLGDVGSWCGGGTPSKQNAAYWDGGVIPWVSPKDMKAFTLHGAEMAVTHLATVETSAKVVPANSVAMVVRSGILKRVFPVSFVPFESTYNQDMRVVTPREGILPVWLAWALRGYGDRILKECSKQGTTVESIDSKRLLAFRVGIPPVEEQQRIITRVEELWALCDEIEEGLLSERALASELAGSAVADLLLA
jgi:hypothetical protein